MFSLCLCLCKFIIDHKDHYEINIWIFQDPPPRYLSHQLSVHHQQEKIQIDQCRATDQSRSNDQNQSIQWKERLKNIFLSKYIIIVINQFNRIRSIKFSWKDHSCDWSEHWQRSFKNIEIDKNRTKFNLWSFKRSIWTDLITDNFSHSWLFKCAKYYCTQKYSVYPNKFMQRFDFNLTLSNFYK